MTVTPSRLSLCTYLSDDPLQQSAVTIVCCGCLSSSAGACCCFVCFTFHTSFIYVFTCNMYIYIHVYVLFAYAQSVLQRPQLVWHVSLTVTHVTCSLIFKKLSMHMSDRTSLPLLPRYPHSIYIIYTNTTIHVYKYMRMYRHTHVCMYDVCEYARHLEWFIASSRRCFFRGGSDGLRPAE